MFCERNYARHNGCRNNKYKISLVIKPLCLVRKIKSTKRLQNKAEDERHQARDVNNILCEFKGGR